MRFIWGNRTAKNGEIAALFDRLATALSCILETLTN